MSLAPTVEADGDGGVAVEAASAVDGATGAAVRSASGAAFASGVETGGGSVRWPGVGVFATRAAEERATAIKPTLEALAGARALLRTDAIAAARLVDRLAGADEGQHVAIVAQAVADAFDAQHMGGVADLRLGGRHDQHPPRFEVRLDVCTPRSILERDADQPDVSSP